MWLLAARLSGVETQECTVVSVGGRGRGSIFPKLVPERETESFAAASKSAEEISGRGSFLRSSGY